MSHISNKTAEKCTHRDNEQSESSQNSWDDTPVTFSDDVQFELENPASERAEGSVRTRRFVQNCHGSSEAEVDGDGACGFFCWKPKFLQTLASPITILVCVCLLVVGQSIVASGYISSIVTTIERRYNLLSSQSGLVLSSYEFTCLLGVVLVSFYGERFNRAHLLAGGGIIIAVGSLVFTFPHFLSERYSVTSVQNSSSDLVCSSSDQEEAACSVPHGETWAFTIFILAQLVIGLGASPVYILGPTYLHDNVWKTWFPVFVGIFYAVSALGPAAGFLLGATFVSIYVDTPVEPPVGLTEDDPLWVGAWWIGFLVVVAILAIAGIVLAMLPRRLPNIEAEEKNDAHSQMGFGGSCSRIPVLIRSVFTQKAWLFISLAIVCEQSVVVGFVNFIAKYTQTTFSVPASQANIVAGGVLIPAAAVGILTGGIMMKRLQPSLVTAFKYMTFLSGTSLLCGASLMAFTCDTIEMAGVTQPYSGLDMNFNLTSVCNVNCSCPTDDYQPVCGGDLLTYFSACHAGCQDLPIGGADEGSHNFTSCGCIDDQWAVSGRCPSSCDTLVPFLVLLFVTIFVTCLGQNPGLVITLSSVGAHERSFALGAQYFLVRSLAFIPAPIYFGLLFDSQCLLWANSCDQQGACLEYDVKNLPYVLFGVFTALKILAFSLCLTGFILMKRSTPYKPYAATVSELSSTTSDGFTAEMPESSTVHSDLQSAV